MGGFRGHDTSRFTGLEDTSPASVWCADADVFSAVACLHQCLRSQASYTAVQVKEGLGFYP